MHTQEMNVIYQLHSSSIFLVYVNGDVRAIKLFFSLILVRLSKKAHGRVRRKGKFSRLEREGARYTAKTDARRHENGVILSRCTRVGEAGPYNKPSESEVAEVASSLVARLTRAAFTSAVVD